MSLIKQLINPKTENYYALKNFVLNGNIQWEWTPNSIGEPEDEEDLEELKYYFEKSNIPWKDRSKCLDVPFYSHCVVDRMTTYDLKCPEREFEIGDDLVPIITSESYTLVRNFLYDLVMANRGNIDSYIRCILRCNFNSVHSDEQGVSIPHQDHDSRVIPHKNILVYFTSAGGKTFVGNEFHSPEEDDIICFDSSSSHYMSPPKSKRRVVMVLTYI
jgi:hypothetical protein